MYNSNLTLKKKIFGIVFVTVIRTVSRINKEAEKYVIMKTSHLFTLGFILFLGFSCEKEPAPVNTEPKPIAVTEKSKKVISAGNRFGFEIFQEILNHEDPDKNLMISPLSIEMALSMTYNGAGGDTKQAFEDVLSGDLKRVVVRLNEEVKKVRAQAKEQIIGRLENLVQTVVDTEEMERLVREALIQDIPDFFAPAMRKVADIIQSEATELLTLHQQRTNRLIEQVRKIAAELFDIPYHAPAVGRSYAKFEISGWSNDLFISDMDPLGQRFSRKFFTHKFRRKRTVNRLREEGTKLLSQNVEQINWALRRGLDESFRQFGAELSEQLENTIIATRKAMEVALSKSASHAQETASREIKLKQAIGGIQKILDQFD